MNIKMPICPTCGEELDMIYPKKDKKLCSFKCGHIIYKKDKLFCEIL